MIERKKERSRKGKTQLKNNQRERERASERQPLSCCCSSESVPSSTGKLLPRGLLPCVSPRRQPAGPEVRRSVCGGIGVTGLREESWRLSTTTSRKKSSPARKWKRKWKEEEKAACELFQLERQEPCSRRSKWITSGGLWFLCQVKVYIWFLWGFEQQICPFQQFSWFDFPCLDLWCSPLPCRERKWVGRSRWKLIQKKKLRENWWKSADFKHFVSASFF